MDLVIKVILILLFVFTPIAFGSMELWAFSVMELGILLIIVLWAVEEFVGSLLAIRHTPHQVHGSAEPNMFQDAPRIPQSEILLLLSIFLGIILFQIIPIPSWMMEILSPKAYELRHSLAITIPQSALPTPQFQISLMPFATKIEFLKWLTLSGLFLFLLCWRFLGGGFRKMNHFIIVIFLMGVFESLYGMFEFFSGRQQILHRMGIPFVSGTFVNRNYFAGYLLMVIPLSMGFLFYRESTKKGRFMNWRQRLAALDGKTILIAFGVMVMILGLLFSASRMGILSLLLAFSVISLAFGDLQKGMKFSKASVLVLSFGILWGVWIGLDAVISGFFTVPNDFKLRWMIWSNTFDILKDFPVLGSGLGTFSQIFPMYRSFYTRSPVTHAENDFVQLASEIGLLGIGVLFILLVFLFYKAISGIRSLSHSEPRRYIGIGGLVGILALMFNSVVERNLQVPANAFLFTFILAMVLRVKGKKIHRTHSDHRGNQDE